MHDIFIVNNCNNYAGLVKQYPHARIVEPSTDLVELYRHVAASAVTKHAWIISDACNYDDFDFDFEPLWHQADQLHVWPSGLQQRGGQTCLINAQQFLAKTVDLDAIQDYQSVCWHNNSIPLQTLPDIVIWNVPGTEHNLEVLQKQYPQAKTLRYVGNHLEMIKKSLRYTSSDEFWILSSGCDYSNFDPGWQPGWEHKSSLHCWASGTQKFGDTFYVPRSEFAEIATAIEELDYYPDIVWHESGYPQMQQADIVIWNVPGFEDNLKKLQNLYPQAKTLRYVGNHLEMIKKSLRYAETKNFWTLSSNCDYSNFDPQWLPSWASRKQLHCWASGTQKFGDTFYVSRSDFEFAAETISELDYYPGIVWHEDGFKRLSWPINYTNCDLLTALKSHKFSSIYEYFVMPGSEIGSTVDSCLWKKRHLIAYNNNGHVSLCPRDCISQISVKVNDYPYIQYHNCKNSTEKPQDIVFMSYDEKNADLNYKILLDRFPNASRLHGVQGLVNAHKKAAEKSSTPWVYIVFAKTKVDESFKFDFNPNYLEMPSNYVFYSYNPVLNHSYGHDGIVMYHAKSVIEIQNWGVDFTMSFPVVTIPMVSCYNNFNYNEYSTWRTAIREAYKLKKTNRINDRYHLHLWLTANHSDNGSWSIRGAQDGISLPNGMEDKINDWQWLKDYFNLKYKKIIEQT